MYGAPLQFPYALMIVRGDDILALGGMFFFDDKVAIFADFSEDAYGYPIAMTKAAKRVISQAKATGREVVTVADDRPEAYRFLEHFGFRARDDGWHGLV